MNIVETEREKYEAIWALPEYHDFSPGLENVQRFIDVVQPTTGGLIDLGCGSGKAGLQLRQRCALEVWWLDITDAALDPAIDRARFIEEPLWGKWRGNYLPWTYGFCCDVMEHVPTEYVMLSLERIRQNCFTTWFQIALLPDQFGAAIGQPLHLTVRPFTWWRDRLKDFGKLVEARDLCGTAVFLLQT